VTPKPSLAGLPPPFDQLLERYEREILRFIMRTTRDREDALDLFQETWMRAYRAYPQLKSAADLRAWLYRIAANLCLNRSRDRARRARVFADGVALPEHDGVRRGDPREHWLSVKKLIERLPRKQQAAIMMRKVAGLEYDEIAQALGCSSESARADVYQAMKKLRMVEE
jgi:RNA polymerase sigma-70 factor (ECF subfamily)